MNTPGDTAREWSLVLTIAASSCGGAAPFHGPWDQTVL